MIYLTAPLYKDALAYSWFGRCFIRSGSLSYSQYMKEMFCSCKVPSIEFLRELTTEGKEAVCKNISIEELILKHTMFPQYAHFLNINDKQKAFEELLCGDRQYNKTLCVNRGKYKKEKYLKYCPICAEENRREYGETFWDRKKQIVGCTVCTKHKCKLKESVVNISNDANDSFKLAEEIVPYDEDVDYWINPLELEISEYLTKVFEQPINMENDILFGEFIHSRLQNTKYLNRYGTSKKITEFYEDFTEYFKNVSDIPINRQERLRTLLSNYRLSFYPVCLVALFLKIPAEELVRMDLLPNNQKLSFEHQIKEMYKNGYSYRKIGKHLGINEYGVRMVLTGKTYSHSYNREVLKKSYKFDWDAIDQENLPVVKSEIQKLLSEEKPQKITKTRVAKLIGKNISCLYKMTLCCAEIDKYYMSQEEYWSKKILWAAAEIRKDETKNFKWYHIQRKAVVGNTTLAACLPYLKDCGDGELLDMIESVISKVDVGEELYG